MRYRVVSLRIRHIRVNLLNMTQPVFAQEIGVSAKSLISMWENEFIERSPSRKTSIKIAELAGVPLDYVMGEDIDIEGEMPVHEIDKMLEEILVKTPTTQRKIIKAMKAIVDVVD
ncbi:helix-turn-helix domain-containing protein [Bacillus sp. NEAU-Y102]